MQIKNNKPLSSSMLLVAGFTTLRNGFKFKSENLFITDFMLYLKEISYINVETQSASQFIPGTVKHM